MERIVPHNGKGDKMSSTVAALARGLEILRCFSAIEPTLSNSEIAAYTELPKSTVSRLTSTLVSLGYLRYDNKTKRYRVGSSVLALGYSALANLRVIDIARPHMQKLADSSNSLVSLATRDRLSMLYLEACSSDASFAFKMGRGIRMPMLTTSIGRAFIAGLPEQEREFFLETFKKRTPQEASPEILKKVYLEIDFFNQHGYCRSMSEWKNGVNAIAAPIPLKLPGSDLMVISISGPSFIVSDNLLEEKLAANLLSLIHHVARQFE